MNDAIIAITDPTMDAVRSSTQPAWAYDIEHHQIAWANDAGLALWRAPNLEALSQKQLESWMAPEAWRQIEAYFLVVRDGARFEQQLTIYPQGEPVTLLCQCSGVRLECGNIAVLVEGRVRTIEAGTLRAVEALNTTKFLVSLLDFEGRVLFENPIALEAHGYTRPSAITRHAFFSRFVDEDAAHDIWAQLLAEEPYEGELEVRTRSGTRWHAVTCATTTDPVTGVRVVLIEERDVTTRRKLDSRTQLHERMASIGELSGGLAHEINNPLAYATMNLDLLEEIAAEGFENADAEELTTILSDIREGMTRIRSTVADLAELARVDTGEPVAADVQAILETAITMTHAHIRHQATVVRDFGEVPWVLARRARLSETFLHVLLHAVRRVEGDPGHAHRIQVSTRPNEDRSRVIVEIGDTSQEQRDGNLDTIFEPFARPVTMGEGLGLSVARRIISDHGGDIRARRNAEGGLTIRIELPASGDHEALERPTAVPRTVEGRRRVLVVDDEPGIRRAITRLLDEHDVDTASSGVEALEILEGASYDVIFCDMMMPVMDGMSFYEELAKRHPGLERKVIFITAGAYTTRTSSSRSRIRRCRSRSVAICSAGSSRAPERLRGSESSLRVRDGSRDRPRRLTRRDEPRRVRVRLVPALRARARARRHDARRARRNDGLPDPAERVRSDGRPRRDEVHPPHERRRAPLVRGVLSHGDREHAEGAGPAVHRDPRVRCRLGRRGSRGGDRARAGARQRRVRRCGSRRPPRAEDRSTRDGRTLRADVREVVGPG